MALGFIKRIFSFGKDDKSAAELPRPDAGPVADVVDESVEASSAELAPETVPGMEETVLDPVTIDHIGDRLIIPDVLEDVPNDPVDDLRQQIESVAEFNEAMEDEPATDIAGTDPVTLPGTGAAPEEPASDSVADGHVGDRLIIPDDLEHARKDLAVELPEQAAPEPVADTAIVIAPETAADRSAASDTDRVAEPEQVTPLSVAALAPEQSQVVDEPRTAPVLPAGFSSASDRIEPEIVTPERKLSWIERLRQGLSRTSAQLTSQISSLFTKRKLDDETLQDLEDLLIQADLGVETALRITDTLAAERYGKDVTGEDVSKIMATEITKVLGPVAKPLELDLSHKPHVILVVGVNGTGKTTTIGKLAAKLTQGGLKVMLAAGDTFRAAAIEQLNIWASRTGADIVSSRLGADAAGLAYEAYEKAKQSGHDVLIIDTAGRLQNKTELMAELEKIVRVLGRLDPDAPHTVLQTLDATTGQNALNQVEIFRNVAGVSGLIMTKLDGTARGGILVAISAKHKLPVCFIGVGEGIDDLEPFNAKDFAEAIAGIQNK